MDWNFVVISHIRKSEPKTAWITGLGGRAIISTAAEGAAEETSTRALTLSGWRSAIWMAEVPPAEFARMVTLSRLSASSRQT